MARFSSSLKKTQLATSMAVRPQPRQISSYRVVQTATHGESDMVKTLGFSSMPGKSPAGLGIKEVIEARLPPRSRPFRQDRSVDDGSLAHQCTATLRAALSLRPTQDRNAQESRNQTATTV